MLCKYGKAISDAAHRNIQGVGMLSRKRQRLLHIINLCSELRCRRVRVSVHTGMGRAKVIKSQLAMLIYKGLSCRFNVMVPILCCNIT